MTCYKNGEMFAYVSWPTLADRPDPTRTEYGGIIPGLGTYFERCLATDISNGAVQPPTLRGAIYAVRLAHLWALRDARLEKSA